MHSTPEPRDAALHELFVSEIRGAAAFDRAASSSAS